MVVLALSNYVFTTFEHAAMPIVIIYNSEPRLGVVRQPVAPWTDTQDDMGVAREQIYSGSFVWESKGIYPEKGTPDEDLWVHGPRTPCGSNLIVQSARARECLIHVSSNG